MSLFTIGSSNTDLVIYLDHIPKIGETVIGGESKVIYGGKGANQAVAAKKAGSQVKFITQLGSDSFGKDLITYFKRLGLPEKYILTDPTQPSGLAHIFVSKQGENSIAVASGANGTLDFDRIAPFLDEISTADVVLIQFEIPIQTIISIINYCHEKEVKVVVNPAPAMTLPDEVLKKIWMITPNESEAELLSGMVVNDQASAIMAGQKLVDSGINHCITTLGEKGSIWISAGGIYAFSVPSVDAIDTTAAGDVFNGYLAHGITSNIPLEKAIAKAHAAACLSVTVKGAQTSIPSKKETDLFIQKNPIIAEKIG
ncbi:MAG: ribokinase [Saprospiraceae bacterium]|nr:ribokinase [Saprospiraceae bacterium]